MHQYQLLIRESHLDSLGHVNHATYLQLLEEARWEMCYEHGLDLEWIKKNGLGPIIIEVNIRYLKEIRLREKITIETRVDEIRGKVGKLAQIIRSENGQELAEASLKFGLFDLTTRKLVPMTDEWLAAFAVG
jgi:YbgC/YbaW family acyl-CoA thioester hydrolase